MGGALTVLHVPADPVSFGAELCDASLHEGVVPAEHGVPLDQEVSSRIDSIHRSHQGTDAVYARR
jgi:hypothetical protein